MGGFFGKSNWANTASKGKKGTGRTLGSRIDSVNQDYISEIQNEITRANTVTKLRQLKLDDDYESDTVKKVEQLVEDKIKELTQVEQVEVKEKIQAEEKEDIARESGKRIYQELLDDISSADTVSRAELVQASVESNIDRKGVTLTSSEISTLRSRAEALVSRLERQELAEIAAREAELERERQRQEAEREQERLKEEAEAEKERQREQAEREEELRRQEEERNRNE